MDTNISPEPAKKFPPKPVATRQEADVRTGLQTAELRQAVIDRVVIALVGYIDVLNGFELGRQVEGAGGDGDIIAAAPLPKKHRAA